MLKDLNIPRMGSVENARMVAWLVTEGAAFAAGDVLYEIETDKTTTEVEADEPGILVRCLAAAGDEFKVGDRIGLWAAPGTRSEALKSALRELDGESVPAAASAPAPRATANPASIGAPGAPVRPVPRSAAGGVRISPLARRLAAIHAVDVSRVQGSGAGGRITGSDVLAAASSVAALPPPQPMPETAPAPAGPVPEGEASLVPHTLRRQTIARRMIQAAAIPSLTADMEIDLTALLERRKREPGSSVLGMIAHEAVAALIAHPRLNAHWQDDAMVQWHTVHLGVAVDTPDGLVVPVIRHAERLSAAGLTAAVAGLAERARTGALRAADLEGGTFTISNPGSIGPVIRAEALLNPPQVALLGLPGMVRQPRAVPDGSGWAMAIRPVIKPSLTFDHRALDGGPVIAFLNDLRTRIEAL